MASKITLVPTEGYNCLPPEALLLILSNLDVQGLGRVARVSKALLGASEDNALWKSRYARRWTLPTEWIDREPSKWKDYYLTVVKVRNCAPEDLEDETATSNFWSLGLPDESANYKARQKTLELQKACVKVAKGAIPILVEDDRTKPQSAQQEEDSWESEDKTQILWSFKFPIESENPQQTANIPLLGESSETHKIFILVLRILSFHRQGDRTQAVQLYLENQKTLTEYSSLLGWWLSEILYLDKTPHKDSDKIPFPIHGKPPKRNRQNFLQGFFLIWLRYGKIDSHFNTLRALRKMAYDSKAHYPEKSPSRTLLEEFLLWTFCRDTSSVALEKLATLYLYFPNHSPRAQELEKARYLYGRIIRSFPSDQIPLYLATNYSLGWLRHKLIDPTTVPREQEGLLTISIFQQALHRRVPIRIKDLKCVAEFTSVFKVERAYPFVRACLNWIKLPYNDKTLPDMVSLFSTKIEFFRQMGNLIEALDAWIDFCNFLSKEKEAQLEKGFDLYQTLYSLLNINQKICEEALLLQSQITDVKLAVAYALYRLNRIDESLQIMMGIAQYFDPLNLEWLKTLGQADLRATVIYSLCLDTPEELENFYLEEMLDYHHTQRFFIYHNLATRIYFIENQSDEEDNASSALKYADEALSLVQDQPETHILMGLCHIYNGDGPEGRSAIKTGETLCPEKFALKKQYSENDLLIFPVDEKKDMAKS